MEEIIYNDNIIHVFNDGHIAVYTMDADGDIHEDWCPSIEAAKRIIDRHIQYMEDEQWKAIYTKNGFSMLEGAVFHGFANVAICLEKILRV